MSMKMHRFARVMSPGLHNAAMSACSLTDFEGDEQNVLALVAVTVVSASALHSNAFPSVRLQLTMTAGPKGLEDSTW